MCVMVSEMTIGVTMPSSCPSHRRANLEPTYLASNTAAMAKQPPEPPPLSTWDVFRRRGGVRRALRWRALAEERAMTGPRLSAEQRRALEILADAGINGVTV